MVQSVEAHAEYVKVINPADVGRGGWWAPVTSSLDFCERNYRFDGIPVAEVFNAASSLALCASGVLGLTVARREGVPRRFKAVAALSIVMGLGSAAFHGTLTWLGQMGDELGMVYLVLGWTYCLLCLDGARPSKDPAGGLHPASTSHWILSPLACGDGKYMSHARDHFAPASEGEGEGVGDDAGRVKLATGEREALGHSLPVLQAQLPREKPWPRERPVLAACLVVYGVLWTAIHVHGLFTTAFQLHFAALVIGSDVVFRRRFEAWRVRGPGRDAVRLAVNLRKAYYGTILGGIGCWLIDMFLCEYIERALPFNPELHALWHIAAAGYVWCAALLALQLQWTDRGQHVTYMGRICGCIPVLRRRKTREE